MNLIWQTAIFVVVGTIVLTTILMGVLRLAIKLQGEPKPIANISDDGNKGHRKLFTFELDGKLVKLEVDVSDAQPVGSQTSRASA